MNQKKQLVVLVVLLLIAGFIWFLYLDHDKPVVTADAIPTPQNYHPIAVDNPQLHNDAVERARKTEYKSAGRNIFSRQLPPPPPPKQVRQDLVAPIVQQAPVPATPTVSPLPVKFFGYGTVPNSRSEEHTSELQSRFDLVCRLLLEKKKHTYHYYLTQRPAYQKTQSLPRPLYDYPTA